jgi:hypothetical protein
MTVFLLEGRVEEISEERSGLSRAYFFQPDTILPFQYAELLRRKTYLEGEKRLIFAVLEDAVSCFQRHCAARDKKGRELFREAEAWIMNENDDQVFSFSNVCESLGINPEYLRRGLMKWKEKQVSRRRRGERKEVKKHGERSGVRHGSR